MNVVYHAKITLTFVLIALTTIITNLIKSTGFAHYNKMLIMILIVRMILSKSNLKDNVSAPQVIRMILKHKYVKNKNSIRKILPRSKNNQPWQLLKLPWQQEWLLE
jgi:hypothetical protein